MRVLVLGGTGVLGRHIAAELRRRGMEPVCVGREADPRRAGALERYVDPGMRAAVIASPTPPGVTQLACARLGLSTVDVGVDPLPDDSVRALRETGGTHVQGVGLLPGLAGLGAVAVTGGQRDAQVDVLLEQSTNATVGPAGVRQMLALLRTGRDARTGDGGALRLDHPETDALADCGIEARYWTRWDDPSLTRGLGLAARRGLMPRLASLPDPVIRAVMRHDERRPETVALRWRGAKRHLDVSASGDYAATAAVVAVTIGRLRDVPPGVHRLWQVLTLEDVLADTGDVLTVI